MTDSNSVTPMFPALEKEDSLTRIANALERIVDLLEDRAKPARKPRKAAMKWVDAMGDKPIEWPFFPCKDGAFWEITETFLDRLGDDSKIGLPRRLVEDKLRAMHQWLTDNEHGRISPAGMSVRCRMWLKRDVAQTKAKHAIKRGSIADAVTNVARRRAGADA